MLACGKRVAAKVRSPVHTGYWICLLPSGHEGLHQWEVYDPDMRVSARTEARKELPEGTDVPALVIEQINAATDWVSQALEEDKADFWERAEVAFRDCAFLCAEAAAVHYRARDAEQEAAGYLQCARCHLWKPASELEEHASKQPASGSTKGANHWRECRGGCG